MSPSLIRTLGGIFAVLGAAAAFASPVTQTIDEPGGMPAGLALVWSDEFEREGLPDPAKWVYDTSRNRTGWANAELQYYSKARRENSRIENGVLIIEARREDTRGFPDSGGQRYTSARLITRGVKSWTYGFFEIRAKLPCQRGSWPAIWMLGDTPKVDWPDVGEIDIMEHVGHDPGVVHGTVHTKAYNHVNNTHRTGTVSIPDACNAFHRYQLTCTPDEILIGHDDRNYFRFERTSPGSRDTWPFDAPQFLLLNIAVGGTWGGEKGVDDGAFPMRMEIDYVRVHQANAAPASRAERPDSEPVVHPELWPKVTNPGVVDKATEARITALLSRLSLEEKVGQVVQADIGSVKPEDLRKYPIGSILAGGSTGPGGNDRAPPETWLKLSREFRAIAMEQRPGHTPIPLMFGVDAVHGHSNMVGATLFPHNIGLGAAHDADLVRRIGVATAEAMAATGIDWTFAPTLAVPQDIRWGRSYEGFAQDPALVREYAKAAVTGLQGAPNLSHKLQSGRVAATAKHFLGDGGTAGGVDQGDTQVSESDLIRLHAQGYVGAIDAGVLTVMASYSSWQGQKMHGNRHLLTDVLKGRMGFQGFVVGDWDGHAQVPGCSSSQCVKAFNAGLDMFMAPYEWKALYENTLAAVRSGEIKRARLDDAVRRILRVKFKLGLFEQERPYEARLELLNNESTRALAREAVRKSLVLLSNDGVLPIRGSAKIYVTGPGAESISMQSGGWSVTWQGNDTTNADFPGAETIKAALGRAIQAGGGRIVDGHDLSGADKPDVAIVVYGEQPYAEMQGDIQVPLYNVGRPLHDLQRLRRAGVRTVSVFLSGRPLWVGPELEASNAFVAAWLPGTEGGNGIADVLIADAQGTPRFDFTGRLSFAWPKGRNAWEQADAWPLGYGLSYSPRLTQSR